MPTDWSIFVSVMNEDKSKLAAKSGFTTFLKSRKLRCTAERELILETVLGINGRFSAERLHGLVETKCHISTATIYNTLQILTEAGIVKRHHFDGQSSLYEKITGASNVTNLHLMCTECGKIKEIRDLEVAKLLHSRRYPTFHTAYFTVCAYGICSRCARKSKKKRQIIT